MEQVTSPGRCYVKWTPEKERSLMSFRITPDGVKNDWVVVADLMNKEYPNEEVPFAHGNCSGKYQILKTKSPIIIPKSNNRYVILS
jgi:hypothetical protein